MKKKMLTGELLWPPPVVADGEEVAKLSELVEILYAL